MKLLYIFLLSIFVYPANSEGVDLNETLGAAKPTVVVSLECSIAIKLAIEDYQNFSKIPDSNYKQLINKFGSVMCSLTSNGITVILFPPRGKNIKGGSVSYYFNKDNIVLTKRTFDR